MYGAKQDCCLINTLLYSLGHAQASTLQAHNHGQALQFQASCICISDANVVALHLQAQLEAAENARQQIAKGVEGLDINSLAEHIELIDKQHAELATLRQQKSMEVNALQFEKEEALQTLKQEHLAAQEALEQTKDIQLQGLQAQIQVLQARLQQTARGVEQQQSQNGHRPDQDDAAPHQLSFARMEQMSKEQYQSQVRPFYHSYHLQSAPGCGGPKASS